MDLKVVSRIITLTTDFGLKDFYVAEMKAVILKINFKSIIVDITHNIPRFNTKQAAWVLASAAQYFPKGTIHVAVVDPGVGTTRRPIIIEGEKQYYIGPDNGIFSLITKIEEIKHIFEIKNKNLTLPQKLCTFDGRDIFAPTAAYLAKGVRIREFGPEIKDVYKISFPQAVQKENKISGEILHIDHFGNIVTNISEEKIKQFQTKNFELNLGATSLKVRLVRSYADGQQKEPIAIIGSHGFLEIAVNQFDASKIFRTKIGDEIIISMV